MVTVGIYELKDYERNTGHLPLMCSMLLNASQTLHTLQKELELKEV